MSRDLLTAFEPPMARSIAQNDSEQLDRISVRDYVREVEIGAFQSERGVTQRIRFNVVLEVSKHSAAQDDDVDKVISYDTITEAIEEQLRTERINLLETLAERVAERCLEDRRAVQAFVRIEKLDRIPGALGVEIARKRVSAETPRVMEKAEITEAEAVRPRVVLLGNDLIASPYLAHWLDALDASDVPVILCVGPADEAHPVAMHANPARRIALLSIEQNAWVLASHDDRCVVVDSRTELDWAMKQGKMSVWAPSKLAYNAGDITVEDRKTAGTLAAWFARSFDAVDTICVGTIDGVAEGFTCVELGPVPAALI